MKLSQLNAFLFLVDCPGKKRVLCDGQCVKKRNCQNGKIVIKEETSDIKQGDTFANKKIPSVN